MTERPALYATDPPMSDGDPRGPEMLAIQRAAPIPYYAQLAEILRRHITEGTWAAGSALPSEAELCDQYGLSRTVVRQALNELVAEGLVVKEKGRGTFVTRPKLADLVVHELRGFHEEMTIRGHDVATIVLAHEMVRATPLIAPDLRIEPHADVVHIGRVRLVDGERIQKVDTWLPADRFGDLMSVNFEVESLYWVLAERYGVHIGGGWRRIEAAVANREMADALGIELGSPMLHLAAVSLDQHGNPFEFFSAFYRGDRTSFEQRHIPTT